MKFEIDWLEPWNLLCTEPSSFEEELYREIGKDHILYGKKVRTIGRRYDKDDFLYIVDDSQFSLAVVHLTYCHHTEENLDFPITKLFKDLDDWVNNCMLPDHEEYVLY